ncbi:MAG: DUF1287 domain-containing protein [Azoarcus sp.]|jgi:uncharacterized protein YijF (DUF1287 family)|nr:DUF1287 domain-containing protein [Azoarcus sp.]
MRVIPYLSALLAAWALLAASAQAEPDERARALVEAARAQIGVTRIYDGSYQSIASANGDVDMARGVCSDVVIRAYRRAFRHDLQTAVHQDMKKAFPAYPKLWGLKAPDPNIDHRRVPNLRVFFARRGAELQGKDFQPGDLVTQTVAGRLPHIAIVSDKRSENGERYLLIHNIGAGVREEDSLEDFPVTGHYRYFP